jgi:ABC-type Fe3+-hydroxamate transport system substrate-binding protein
MKFQRALATLMVLALLTIAIPVVTQADSANDSVISVTDSRGVTTNLTRPAVHVASFGAFATNTMVDIGMLDAAVMFDASSEFNKSAIPEMQGMPADMFITVSSTNQDAVVQKMLDLVDDGAWNKSTDVIFGYGYSFLSPTWAELEGLGFKVITFYPNSYDGIVQVVRDIETVMGAEHELSDWMGFVKDYIGETLSLNGIDEESEFVTALYASYSSNTLKLGNNGSVTVDFIGSAGGANVAEDANKTVPTYTADFTAILQLSPEYVLLDGYYSGTAEDFSDMIMDDSITVYKLNKSWNSYCPDATEGLWTVACLFYPDHFEGEVPVEGQPVIGPISMTDSRGVITNLTAPATHVASFGAFATNTLVDIGMLDKAVIFDATSEFNKSAIPEMQGMPADMFVTVSSSNKDMVVQTMLDLVDDGKWNKSSDVVMGYGYSYLSTVWTDLEDYGFNVVTFYPNSYDGIVQVVEDIETLTGANHSVSAHMTFVKEYIAQTLEDNGIDNDTERVTAIYASYSSETLKIGNNGSVTVDFINYAGGLNLGEDPEKTLPTYSADFSAILLLNPEFVLLDGYYAGSADDFKAMINDDDVVVYKLNKSWNSYCPDATEGLWTVACLFYPDYFEGELPVDMGDAEDDQDDTMIYAVVGIVVIVVAIAAVLLLRRKD